MDIYYIYIYYTHTVACVKLKPKPIWNGWPLPVAHDNILERPHNIKMASNCHLSFSCLECSGGDDYPEMELRVVYLHLLYLLCGTCHFHLSPWTNNSCLSHSLVLRRYFTHFYTIFIWSQFSGNTNTRNRGHFSEHVSDCGASSLWHSFDGDEGQQSSRWHRHHCILAVAYQIATTKHVHLWKDNGADDLYESACRSSEIHLVCARAQIRSKHLSIKHSWKHWKVSWVHFAKCRSRCIVHYSSHVLCPEVCIVTLPRKQLDDFWGSQKDLEACSLALQW